KQAAAIVMMMFRLAPFHFPGVVLHGIMMFEHCLLLALRSTHCDLRGSVAEIPSCIHQFPGIGKCVRLGFSNWQLAKTRPFAPGCSQLTSALIVVGANPGLCQSGIALVRYGLLTGHYCGSSTLSLT